MEGPYVRCLMVESGQEKIVYQLLRIRRLGRAMFPQRVRIRKMRGTWRQDKVRLLPGYVFVFSDEEIPIQRYYGSDHVLKVLRYDREPQGYLRGNDLEFALTLKDLDGRLDILDAVDEDGFIRVQDLIVEKLHGEILSVDKSKRIVKVRINFMDQPHVLLMNYQLVDDQGAPIDPVTEMLEDESDEWFTAWTPDFSDDLAEQLDAEMGLAAEDEWMLPPENEDEISLEALQESGVELALDEDFLREISGLDGDEDGEEEPRDAEDGEEEEQTK